jgi:hypothetical protein
MKFYKLHREKIQNLVLELLEERSNNRLNAAALHLFSGKTPAGVR